MKKTIVILIIGIMASVAAFLVAKPREEANRQLEFNLKAQSHATAIRAELTSVAKQVADMRAVLEYEINDDKLDVRVPKKFMAMVEPMVTQDSALRDIGWAVHLKENKKEELRIIYAGLGDFLHENIHMDDTKPMLTGFIYPYVLQDNNSETGVPLLQKQQAFTNELQLISPVTDTKHAFSPYYKGHLTGALLGAVVTEWDLSQLVERALKGMPTNAQDITLEVANKPEGQDEVSNSRNQQLESFKTVYFHASRSRRGDETDMHTDIRHVVDFDFANLHWKLTFEAAPAFAHEFPIVRSWQILIIGLLITLIAAYAMTTSSRYRRIIEAKVKQRTIALRKSEEHFRSIVDGLQDVYYRTDMDGIIQLVSPSVRSLGYDAEEVIGTNILRFYVDEQGRDKFIQALAATPKGKIYNYHLESLNKDGTKRWISTNSQFVYDDDGNVAGIEGTLRDFTESKQNQEKLQHTDRLESLGVLAGGIAHNFNNILSGMIGNASIARLDLPDDSPVVPFLDSIEDAGMDAADLCSQMLAYAGKVQYFLGAVNLNELVNSIAKLIRVSLNKKTELTFALAENLPVIEADSAQMQQLVFNLISNASESFVDEDGHQVKSGEVRVSTGVMDVDAEYLKRALESEYLEPGSYVYFEVLDTGCGMSQNVMEKIFEPFFTTKFVGRGLGMSVIRGIVKSHHGLMVIGSEEGKGTIIRVCFPVSKQVKKVSESKEISNRQETMKPQALCGKQGKGTILIVDDEDVVRDTSKMLVESLGYQTLTANDGQHGIDVFKQHQDEIVMVLLDLTMPRMNGADCFDALRAINPDIRVIISSGYAENEAIEQLSDATGVAFIQKPYSRARLAQIL